MQNGGQDLIDKSDPVGAPTHQTPKDPDTVPGSRPKWFRVLTLAVALAVAVGTGIGFGLLVFAAVLVPLELLFPRHRQRILRPGIATDVLHSLYSVTLASVLIGIPILIAATVFHPLTILPVKAWLIGQSALVQTLIAVLFFELVGYWAHRLKHTVPLFWRFHSIHHSSTQLDWIAGSRTHPFEALIDGTITAIPVVVLGFDALPVATAVTVIQLWAVLQHANVRWRMRALDGVMASPEVHHWHHANEPAAVNKNYSGFLPVLDVLFGTYYLPKDRRPLRYGINDQVSETFLGQMAHPFRRKWPDLARPQSGDGP